MQSNQSLDVTLIVFSKDRPMQLTAYLESLLYYTTIQHDQIYVICTKTDEYQSCLELDFTDVNFVYEEDYGSFSNALNSVVGLANDLIWFAVDDFVWFNSFGTYCINILNAENDAVGFSLRLGTSITDYDDSWNVSLNPRIVKMNWLNKPRHFGYPFELSQSVYRKDLVTEIIDKFKNRIRIPNDLEAIGVSYVIENYRNRPYLLFMNEPPLGACVDINRTQDLYQNRVQGGEDLNIESLLQLYNNGKRIDWRNYSGLVAPDCFIGTDKLKIK
ncbi:MAG: hypothetical protein BAJALOKI3v1_50058 [Promethearchaeota archaeon]|nr:MAG: hypothetical protein BAJALOKI3v1_50058 [Candidatus Lokiarchaeota archaeon]